MSDGFIEPRPDGVLLAVKVVPNASRSRVVGLLGAALKVSVAAAPEEGRANRAVETLLAQWLGVPGNQVKIIAGQTQPRKRVLIMGMSAEQVTAAVSALPARGSG